MRVVDQQIGQLGHPLPWPWAALGLFHFSVIEQGSGCGEGCRRFPSLPLTASASSWMCAPPQPQLACSRGAGDPLFEVYFGISVAIVSADRFASVRSSPGATGSWRRSAAALYQSCCRATRSRASVYRVVYPTLLQHYGEAALADHRDVTKGHLKDISALNC